MDFSTALLSVIIIGARRTTLDHQYKYMDHVDSVPFLPTPPKLTFSVLSSEDDIFGMPIFVLFPRNFVPRWESYILSDESSLPFAQRIVDPRSPFAQHGNCQT